MGRVSAKSSDALDFARRCSDIDHTFFGLIRPGARITAEVKRLATRCVSHLHGDDHLRQGASRAVVITPSRVCGPVAGVPRVSRS